MEAASSLRGAYTLLFAGATLACLLAGLRARDIDHEDVGVCWRCC